MKRHDRLQIPPLPETGKETRQAFVQQHGDVLRRFWVEEFLKLIAEGSIDPRRTVGRHWEGDDEETAEKIADRIVDKLASAATLEPCPPWSAVMVWWSWLIGHRARASEKYFLNLPTGRGADEAATVHEGIHARTTERNAARLEFVRVCALFILTWRVALEHVVQGTGVLALEAYWLWATVVARREVIQVIRAGLEPDDETDPNVWLEDDKKQLIAATETPGDTNRDRNRRSRGGAAAAFRFNVQVLRMAHLEANRSGALKYLPRAVGLDPAAIRCAVEIYLGDAAPAFPYPPLSHPADSTIAFEAALRGAAMTIAGPRGDIGDLWNDVLRQGLQKEATRLIPRRLEEGVRRRWTDLVRQGVTETKPCT